MNWADKTVLRSIKFYQKVNACRPKGIRNGCRFYPSCSVYTYQAVERYGTIKGLFLGLKRISRCHPFSKGGSDPLK